MAIYSRIDQEELIWPSFLGKVRKKNTDHSFRDIFDSLVGKVNQYCRPAGKDVISSGPSSAAKIMRKYTYAGTCTA